MKKFTSSVYFVRSFLMVTYILLSSTINSSVIAQGSCQNETAIFEEDFGSGTTPSSHPDIIATALTYQPNGFLLTAGTYKVANNTQQNTNWHASPDHTGNTNGKMLVVNGNGNTFYSHVVNRSSGFPAGNYSARLFLMNVTKEILCVTDIFDPQITFSLEYQAADNSWVALGGSPITTPEVPVSVSLTWVQLRRVFTLPATGSFNVQNIRLTLNDALQSGCGIDYALDDIRLAMCASGGPLPVDFLDVSAKQNGAGIAINWSTVSEINHKYFDVEKSIDDGVNWNLVSTVKINGGISTVKKYHAFDSKPIAGNNYYRIKQVDMDGDFMYSKTVLVKINFDKTVASVLTNPISSSIVIDFLSHAIQPVLVTLFDLSGKKIATERWVIPKGYSRKICYKVKNIQKGIYILNIYDEKGSSIYKGKILN